MLCHQMEEIWNQTCLSSPECTSYTKKWHKCPWPPLQLYYSLSPSLYLWPHEEFPKTNWQRKRRLVPGFQMCLYDTQPQLESGQLWYSAPLGHLLRTKWWEILLLDRTLSSAPSCAPCLEGDMARCVITYCPRAVANYYVTGWAGT